MHSGMRSLQLKKLLSRFDTSNPLVLVFVDSHYRKVFQNWYLYSRQYLAQNLLVVALDREIHEYLETQDISTVLLDWDKNVDSLWKKRVELIYEVLSSGYDVVHSDADAVWQADPFPYLTTLDEDLVFSQGTFWPHDVYKDQRIVLCCGFFSVRANVRTVAFIEEWLDAMDRDHDDQRVLNRLLIAHGLSWNRQSDYELEYKDQAIKCYNNVERKVLQNGLSVALLPHARFQRLLEDKDAVVTHLLSEKRGEDTETTLRGYNLWKLVD